MSAFWSTVKAGSKTKTGQKIISALTGGKQKTTGTEVIKKFSPLKKFKGQKVLTIKDNPNYKCNFHSQTTCVPIFQRT